MSEELKPCPFCGGGASFKPRSFKASCDRCGAFVPVGANSSDEAITAWNTRAPAWQDISTLRYDTTVLIGWTNGTISQDYWYDQTKEEWLASRKRKPFHDGDPWVVPYCWMPGPELPEPPQSGEGE